MIHQSLHGSSYRGDNVQLDSVVFSLFTDHSKSNENMVIKTLSTDAKDGGKEFTFASKSGLTYQIQANQSSALAQEAKGLGIPEAPFYQKNAVIVDDAVPYITVEPISKASLLTLLPKFAEDLGAKANILENYSIDLKKFKKVAFNKDHLDAYTGDQVKNQIFYVEYRKLNSKNVPSKKVTSVDVIKTEYYDFEKQDVAVFYDPSRPEADFPDTVGFDTFNKSDTESPNGVFVEKDAQGKYFFYVNSESRNYFHLKAEFNPETGFFEGSAMHMESDDSDVEIQYQVVVKLLESK